MKLLEKVLPSNTEPTLAEAHQEIFDRLEQLDLDNPQNEECGLANAECFSSLQRLVRQGKYDS